MNETREKLVNIISEQTCFQSPCISGCNQCRQLADSLISSGLIFNPETDIRTKFKIGQEVFMIHLGVVVKSKIYDFGVDNIGFFYSVFAGNFRVRENNLFSIEAKAQAALEERKNEN